MEITDPGAMRALAHPLRIRLLEIVALNGPITAARCAELVGESPANCSFHLRTLGEHGYIERAPGDTARDRPWRITDIQQDLDRSHVSPEAEEAAGTLGATLLEWELARIRLGDAVKVPDAWRGTLGSGGATLFLTPEEAAELNRGIRRLLEPYIERITDRRLRPRGAEPVRFFHASTLVPGLVLAEVQRTGDENTRDDR